MRRPLLVAAAVQALLVLGGCASIGEPMYPSLNIPTRVTDLRVAEHADKLVVDFTIPNTTTDAVTLKHVREVELMVGEKRIPVDQDLPGSVHVEAPVSGLAGKDVLVHVRLVGTKGHPSEWSNPVTVTLLPPLPPPSKLEAANVAEGVKLTWTAGPDENHFRIYRDKNQIGESDTPEYVDKTTEYAKTYAYAVQGVNGIADSDLTQPVSITPEDKFPPAVPTGLTASPGINTVELAWDRNTEPDFKGYRVYRSVNNGAFERIADMIEGPSFSDKNVEAGKHYRYAVSAVDQANNESSHSAPVEITL